MKSTLYLSVLGGLIITAFNLPHPASASGSWQAPFDTVVAVSTSTDSVLSLGDALRLTAERNPTLQSLSFENLAAKAQLKQAGLWLNPELALEVEEVGWDAPGLRESEITLSIAQEFELFGQRGARKQLARAEIDAIELETRISSFDLYLEVKRRFYALAHAQQHLELSQTSVKLATDIIDNINLRITKGAALQSELLLAQLEKGRVRLAFEQAQNEKTAAEAALIALWDGDAHATTVICESELGLEKVMRRVKSLNFSLDSSRSVMELNRRSAIIQARRSLAAAEARPGITLSSGYRRGKIDDSDTFLFGISMPLPLLNRNQGTQKSLEARLRSLGHQLDRERLDAAATINVHSIRLYELMHRHDALDSLLLPTAEKAYEIIRQAYESGRLSYTQLLEAERSLNELRFEHNDMLLAIHEQIITLESLTGVSLRTDKEN